jgi:hypothetical protein
MTVGATRLVAIVIAVGLSSPRAAQADFSESAVAVGILGRNAFSASCSSSASSGYRARPMRTHSDRIDSKMLSARGSRSFVLPECRMATTSPAGSPQTRLVVRSSS